MLPHGEALVELDRRTSQIEILAIELSHAVQAGDLDRARGQLLDLREALALTETTLVVTAAAGGGPIAVALAEHPAYVRALAGREHAFAERLIAVLVQLAHLRHAVRGDVRFAHGLLEAADVERFVREEAGRINAAWLWGKRTDRVGALSHAQASLRAIGAHRGVLCFLAEATRAESEIARRAAAQLTALLEVHGE